MTTRDDGGAPGRLPGVAWRLLAFASVTVLLLVLTQWAALAPLLRLGTRLGAPGAATTTTLALALLAAHAVAVRWLDDGGGPGVGLGQDAWGVRGLAHGTAIGVLAIGVPVLMLLATGWLRLEAASAGSSLALAVRLGVVLLPAALWEELAFRGYVFGVLRDGFGLGAAVGATSVAFGLVHVVNAGATLQTTALVTLAGVWLAAVRVVTGSLAAAWLAHWGWNWTLAALLHAPVSGMAGDLADYRLVDAGPDWATGGPWGPEGGVAAGLGMLAALAYLGAARGARLTRDESPHENRT